LKPEKLKKGGALFLFAPILRPGAGHGRAGFMVQKLFVEWKKDPCSHCRS
jgi:hypothetical protein